MRYYYIKKNKKTRRDGGYDMKFKHKLAKFFGKHAETRDDHVDPTLITRYYNTTKTRGMKTLEELFSGSEVYKVNSISEDHGEISLLKRKGKKAFIIMTVIMVRPSKTAVDFAVTTETLLPFDFGYSSRLIQDLYEQVNKKLYKVD